MADITVRFRHPLDGMWARSLIEELSEEGDVELEQPLEVRSI